MAEISIIIPAYNEKDRIVKTIEQIRKYMDISGNLYEIVIVDDGSTDGMASAVWSSILTEKTQNLKIIRYGKNKGKGYAVKQGLINSKYPFKLVLDADHSVKAKELEQLPSFLFRGHGIIAGERIQTIRQPFYRIGVGKVWKILVFLKTGLWRDTQCPFKLINMPEEFYTNLKTEGFAYDVELLWNANRLRWIKVRYENDRNTKVTLRKTAKMFFELIEI